MGVADRARIETSRRWMRRCVAAGVAVLIADLGGPRVAAFGLGLVVSVLWASRAAARGEYAKLGDHVMFLTVVCAFAAGAAPLGWAVLAGAAVIGASRYASVEPSPLSIAALLPLTSGVLAAAWLVFFGPLAATLDAGFKAAAFAVLFILGLVAAINWRNSLFGPPSDGVAEERPDDAVRWVCACSAAGIGVFALFLPQGARQPAMLAAAVALGAAELPAAWAKGAAVFSAAVASIWLGARHGAGVVACVPLYLGLLAALAGRTTLSWLDGDFGAIGAAMLVVGLAPKTGLVPRFAEGLGVLEGPSAGLTAASFALDWFGLVLLRMEYLRRKRAAEELAPPVLPHADVDLPEPSSAQARPAAPEHVRSGTFTVDSAKALEKLARYQLESAEDFLLPLLRCAVASGARKIELDKINYGLQLRFDGRPLPAVRLGAPHAALLDDDSSAAERHLARGLLALSRLRPRLVVLASGGEAGRAMARFCRKVGDDWSPVPTPETGTVIQVLWDGFQFRDFPGEYLRRAAGAFGLDEAELRLNGTIVHPFRQLPELRADIKDDARWGYVAPAPDSGTGLVHPYVLGVRAQPVAVELEIPVEVHWRDDAIPLDLSNSKAIQGSWLQSVLSKAKRAGPGLVVAALAFAPAGGLDSQVIDLGRGLLVGDWEPWRRRRRWQPLADWVVRSAGETLQRKEKGLSPETVRTLERLNALRR